MVGVEGLKGSHLNFAILILIVLWQLCRETIDYDENYLQTHFTLQLNYKFFLRLKHTIQQT